MAYEFSGSIALGTIVTQNVTGASNPQSRRSGGKFSPSGTKLAVPVWVAPGSNSKIEIYQSGSSGWAMVEDFITGTPDVNKNPGQLVWLSETSLALGLRGPGSEMGVYTYVSSSDHGYYDRNHNQSVRRTLTFDSGGMLEFNPSKTLMISYKPSPASSAGKKTDVHIVDDDGLWLSVQVPSSTTGEEYIASVEWLSDTDFAVGQPAHTEAGGGSNHGKINIYRTTDGGSSFSSIETVVGEDGDKIGASLHYHTASGGLIVGTGTPTSLAADDNGGNKWYLYQSSSAGGYLQGTTDRTELTSTGSWSGRVPLDYNMQANETGGSVFAIQTLPSFNASNAEVLVWESGSEGWKASVIDNNVSYKTINPTSTPLVGLSKLGFVANNNDVSPTNDAADKSFRVHALGEGCETLSEYQLSGSITCGKVTTTIINARTSTNSNGGSISPDGNRIAVASQRVGGATAGNNGIDFFHSSSTGWSEVVGDFIDMSNVAGVSDFSPVSIYWFSNSEILALKSEELISFVSSSSGWSHNYTTDFGTAAGMANMWVSPGKTVIGIAPGINVHGSVSHVKDDVSALLIHSSSTGFDSIKVLNDAQNGFNGGRPTAMAWPDEKNVLVGQPFKNDVGVVTHFRSGSSGYTSIRATQGNASAVNGVLRFGSFVYWHSASNSGIYGADNGAAILNLIPSQSDGYLPASNPHTATGRSLIDTSMLQCQNGAAPPKVLGTTISIDPANPNRVVASTIRQTNDTAQDGRVYFSLETGSLGWKVKQINPDGDGVGLDTANSFNPSQLTPGASRYVTFKEGNAEASDNNKITIYETGLPLLPLGGSGGGGGGGSSPTVSITPDSITLSETGTTANVVVTLSEDPGSNTVTVSPSGLDATEVSVSHATQSLTTSNWDSGVTFVFTGQDDLIDDGNQTFNVTFTTTCSGDSSFDNLTETLSVTVQDDDTAGFTIGTGSLNLLEGESGTISVVLTAQPLGDVVISSSLASIFNGRATISPSQLTFTNLNWNTASNVTVSAISDRIDNGDVTGSVTFSIVPGSSSDEYDSVLNQTASLIVRDDDTAGFTISPSSPININEGDSATISVVLNSQPTSSVTIDVSAAVDWNSRASLLPTSVTFTTSSWETAQDITITTVHDNQINGNQSDTVTFSVNDGSTNDTKFKAVSDQTISVTVVDNDEAGFVLIPGSFISLTEQGASQTLSVKLKSQPSQNVTASLTGMDATEASVVPSELVFTPSNWNEVQPLVFTGVDDDIADGNQQFTATLTAVTGDSNFSGNSVSITVLNVDDDVDTPSAPKESTTKSGTNQTSPEDKDMGTTERIGNTEVARTVADTLPRKLHFDPSTIENIDRSVLRYLTKLNLFSDTNDGWRKVPIIWGTAERAYQVKHNKDVRDQQGMLKLPLISIRRTSLTKDMPSKGVFQGTSPAYNDEQGGSLAVGRMIYQDKTTKFANADAARLHNQSNYRRHNQKVVYRTVSAPMPVNVSVMYEITIRTEYQQQMNHLILPFITTPGTINYVRLFDGEHRYEAFIQGDMQNNDNLSDFSSDERKFETKIQLKVIGYLIGEENNREKPHYAIRENAVEIKIPRERISLAEIPEMEYGRYYGLGGIPEDQLKDSNPFFSRSRKDPRLPFFFSNVPAVGAGLAADVVAGGSSSSTTDVSTNLVTKGNFSETLADNMVVRELVKADDTPPPSPANQVVVTLATIRENTESVFVNGMIQALGSGNDYTISGNTITFTYDLVESDSVYVTYIKG